MAKHGKKNGHAADFQEDAPRNGVGHNSEGRKEAIKKAHEETYSLEKQEETLMEKYITPIRQKRSEIKSELKKTYEITAPQFNARHGVYYFEREAADGNDWITLEIIKEQWDATPVGAGMDLVDIAEKATVQRAERAAAKAKVQTPPEAPL